MSNSNQSRLVLQPLFLVFAAMLMSMMTLGLGTTSEVLAQDGEEPLNLDRERMEAARSLAKVLLRESAT